MYMCITIYSRKHQVYICRISFKERRFHKTWIEKFNMPSITLYSSSTTLSPLPPEKALTRTIKFSHHCWTWRAEFGGRCEENHSPLRFQLPCVCLRYLGQQNGCRAASALRATFARRRSMVCQISQGRPVQAFFQFFAAFFSRHNLPCYQGGKTPLRRMRLGGEHRRKERRL